MFVSILVLLTTHNQSNNKIEIYLLYQSELYVMNYNFVNLYSILIIGISNESYLTVDLILYIIHMGFVFNLYIEENCFNKVL